jgi:ribosome-associated protein
LTFALADSPSLPDELRDRLVARFGASLTVVADESRSQLRNREVALDRLEARLAGALAPRRARRSTKPGAAAVQRRLDAKRRQSQRKAARRVDPEHD